MKTQWLQSIFVWLCLTLMANPIFIFSLQAEDPPPTHCQLKKNGSIWTTINNSVMLKAGL